MNALVRVDAGACGFQALGRAVSVDDQHVTFELESECPQLRKLAQVLRHATPFDAYREVATNLRSQLMSVCMEILPGCCAGCAVPMALFKAMQVSAGLALPRDVVIRIEKG